MPEPMSYETWLSCLETKAPWWQRVAEASLVRLGEAVPSSHIDRHMSDSRLSWEFR